MPSDQTPGMRLGFHFDVLCPWAYQTSKWARTVRESAPIEIDRRFFSLEETNREERKKLPWEREWSYGWSMMRVAALLRRSSMDDCDRFYEAAGRALHEEGRKPHRPEVAEEICAALGLDPGVVRAATGQEALDLWELTVAYSSVPHLYELVPRLYELKTPKTDADMDHIAGVFRAYFEAQDWESREKTAP